MNFIDKIKSVSIWTPRKEVVDPGRRRFLRNVAGAAVGALVLPPAALLPTKTIVTVPDMTHVNDYLDLQSAYLRPISQPLYDTELFAFKKVPYEITFFQRPPEAT